MRHMAFASEKQYTKGLALEEGSCFGIWDVVKLLVGTECHRLFAIGDDKLRSEYDTHQVYID